MNDFNHRVVESLDYLNKVLAGIFISLAVFKFFDMVLDNLLGAFIESLTMIGVGIMTCGFLSLLILIDSKLSKILERLGR